MSPISFRFAQTGSLQFVGSLYILRSDRVKLDSSFVWSYTDHAVKETASNGLSVRLHSEVLVRKGIRASRCFQISSKYLQEEQEAIVFSSCQS